jgi:2-keto-4-pentenoate hydratase/2-oxohepta-3-ene-1,7-dioic acid hydratase in catechol pathway
MRLVRFTQDGDTARIGAHRREHDVVVDLQTVGNELSVGLSDTVPELLAESRWREKLDLLVTHAAETGVGEHDVDAIELLAPIESPGKIICVGLNYIEHVREGGQERPENPILFSKFTNAINDPGAVIEWDPALTEEVDYEAELALVVSDHARRIEPGEATDHLAGYTVANDVSARDLQFADDQWVRGKSLDGFCPLGPAIVTPDELDDPGDCSIWAELNGTRLQESTTANLIFDIDTLVSFCSDAFTLAPGDVILTGTPPGVGAFREPPVYLEDGDTIEVGIEGIGTLGNHCRHD